MAVGEEQQLPNNHQKEQDLFEGTLKDLSKATDALVRDIGIGARIRVTRQSTSGWGNISRRLVYVVGARNSATIQIGRTSPASTDAISMTT